MGGALEGVAAALLDAGYMGYRVASTASDGVLSSPDDLLPPSDLQSAGEGGSTSEVLSGSVLSGKGIAKCDGTTSTNQHNNSTIGLFDHVSQETVLNSSGQRMIVEQNSMRAQINTDLALTTAGTRVDGPCHYESH